MNGERFIQRELSWNAFNARVFSQGMRKDLGLLDRLKFMAITCSNYDEFFMVRVARLMRELREGDSPMPPAGRRPSAVLADLLGEIRRVAEGVDEAITQDILPALAREGLIVLPPQRWGPEENAHADRVFDAELFPTCTPIVLPDQESVVRRIAAGRICAGFLLDDGHVGYVRLPENLPRFRDFPTAGGDRIVMLLEDVLLTCGERFFPGGKIAARTLFRIIRDADMTVDEERDEDFVAAMEEILESRKIGFPVRLESCGDRNLGDFIRGRIGLPPENHFHFSGPLNLGGFRELALLPGFDNLRRMPALPRIPEDFGDGEDIWETLKDRDLLLHHPYESFAPVIRIVEAAAADPATLALKMILYRTSGDSPIVSALIRAADRGVQVMVLVELKARFDEGANIGWAERLEQAGAIVVYGLAALKVHAKALMVVRREDAGIRRYLHLSTGNYNDSTAKLYTDMALITSREEITREAALVFNAVTGYSAEPHLRILHMAPFSLRGETVRLIRREAERAAAGEQARIVGKMNALVDPEIIETLYDASAAGVRINLNVRGICALRPGVEGMSENIRVVSIIDEFLEHTRAFSYHNGGSVEVYLSSADWMTRNLDRRVELLFPVLEATHKRRIIAALDAYFRDNARSWILGSDGTWSPRRPGEGEEEFRVQEHFAKSAARQAAERESAERKAPSVRRKPPGGVPGAAD